MGKGIVKYRYVILAVFIALIVVSVIFLPTMIERVNYDLTSYLPDDYETSKGYAFLSETFNIHGDVEIGVTATRGEISKAAEEILKLDGVTNAIWAQYMETLLELGVYSADDGEFLDMYNIFTDALDKGAVQKDADGNAVLDENGNFVYVDGKECNWALLVTLRYPPSSQEAIRVFGEIENVLNDIAGEGSYAMSGMTEQANALYETVFDELWIYLVAAGIVVLVILAFTTNSLMEPIILILTLGVSIIINLGTNAIFPSTSMITFAVTAILQLGLSMDYAIFLLHQYRDELRTTCDPKQALAAAIPKSAKAVASSALTTIVGFLALMCMQFEIGTDLGLSLAKGIICSLVTVLLLQPCLMLLLDKARVKTQHKCLDFRFRAPIKRSIRDRGWVSLVFAVLFIPALIGSLTLGYTYVRFMPEPDTSGYTPDQMWNYSTAKELGNQVMIIVPNERADENGNPVLDENGNHVYYIDENYEFVRRLKELGAETVQVDGQTLGKLSYQLGMYVMIPEGTVIEAFDGVSLSLEQVFILAGDILPLAEEIAASETISLTQEQIDTAVRALRSVFPNGITVGDTTISIDIIASFIGTLDGMTVDELEQALADLGLDLSAFADMQSQMAMFQSYVNGGYTMYTVGINPAIDFDQLRHPGRGESHRERDLRGHRDALLLHGVHTRRVRFRGSHSRRLQPRHRDIHRRDTRHSYLHAGRNKIPRTARRAHRVRHMDQPHHAIHIRGRHDQLHVLPRHHGGAAGRDGGLRHTHHHEVPHAAQAFRTQTGGISRHHRLGDVGAHFRTHHGGRMFQHICGVVQPCHTGDDLPHRARSTDKRNTRHIRTSRPALFCRQADGKRNAHQPHEIPASRQAETPQKVRPETCRNRTAGFGQ